MALSDAIRKTRTRLEDESRGGITMDAEAARDLIATLALWETRAANLEYGVEIGRKLAAKHGNVSVFDPSPSVPAFPDPQRKAS